MALPNLLIPSDSLHGSRGCLGCCMTSPTVIMSAQGQEGKKSCIGGEFWSSSSGDVPRSVHPIKPTIFMGMSEILNVLLNSQIMATLLWLKTRQQWVENRTSQSRKQVQEPRISWNANYENLLVTNNPFPQPIPLPAMVDFLVDIWEQDGLYD